MGGSKFLLENWRFPEIQGPQNHGFNMFQYWDGLLLDDLGYPFFRKPHFTNHHEFILLRHGRPTEIIQIELAKKNSAPTCLPSGSSAASVSVFRY